MDKHYHPIVWNRLQQFAAQQDWQGLEDYLKGLSNSHFRTAGYLIGERIMPSLSEDAFWALFLQLMRYNSKAFLVTMLKSASARITDNHLSIYHPGFLQIADQIEPHSEDCRKLLQQLLPAMKSAADVEALLKALHVTEPMTRLTHLLRINTCPCYFVLLHTLHYLEHDRALLIRTTHFLMKRGDGLSFNFASLLRSIYGLEEVSGTFSLRLQPYELARIEASFEVFAATIG